jgi:hypothetical protein
MNKHLAKVHGLGPDGTKLAEAKDEEPAPPGDQDPWPSGLSSDTLPKVDAEKTAAPPPPRFAFRVDGDVLLIRETRRGRGRGRRTRTVAVIPRDQWPELKELLAQAPPETPVSTVPDKGEAPPEQPALPEPVVAAAVEPAPSQTEEALPEEPTAPQVEEALPEEPAPAQTAEAVAEAEEPAPSEPEETPTDEAGPEPLEPAQPEPLKESAGSGLSPQES